MMNNKSLNAKEKKQKQKQKMKTKTKTKNKNKNILLSEQKTATHIYMLTNG